MEIDELDGDNDIEARRDNEDDVDDLSSFSSSLSMDEEEEDEEEEEEEEEDMGSNLPRRGPSVTSSARKRTSGVESHSDSESQFDSALESHPNSDSESDPDLESRPHSPKSFKPATHRLSATTTASTGTNFSNERRQSSHSIRRQSYASSDQRRPTEFNKSHDDGRQDYDLSSSHNDALLGLSTLAAAARKLPRRELASEGVVSAHEDSNASESEG
ncbi:hypothetical protein BGZ76_006559, partial [Entomortierella beljakovae]